VETLTALPTLSAVALVGLMARMLWVAVADELTAMTKQQRSAQAVRLWNLTYPIGTKVVLDPQTTAKHTHTTSTAWVLCGEAVVSVAGECGSAALARVVVDDGKSKEKELKHTKEPWQCVSCKGIVNVVANGTTVATCKPQESDEIIDCLNAARIVACVNACEGIADPSAIPDAIRDLQTLVELGWKNVRKGDDAKTLERIENTLAKLKGCA
jgi:hypothetical protein